MTWAGWCNDTTGFIWPRGSSGDDSGEMDPWMTCWASENRVELDPPQWTFDQVVSMRLAGSELPCRERVIGKPIG